MKFPVFNEEISGYQPVENSCVVSRISTDVPRISKEAFCAIARNILQPLIKYTLFPVYYSTNCKALLKANLLAVMLLCIDITKEDQYYLLRLLFHFSTLEWEGPESRIDSSDLAVISCNEFFENTAPKDNCPVWHTCFYR